MNSSQSSSPDKVHQIVIVGASFGGLPTAHGLIRDILPAVSQSQNKTYKVVLIAPSDSFFWTIGAPRMVAKPNTLPLDKLLLPIADEFEQYSSDSYEFIHASAISIDPATRIVATSTNKDIRYDSLVIASGLTYASSVWNTSRGLDALKGELSNLHEALQPAGSVLISGGGPIGTETAGELGDAYQGKKKITLVSGSRQLLPRLQNKNLGRDAETYLHQSGVDVVHNVRVLSDEKAADGRTTLRLNDGSEKVVDVYINATGGQPNTEFVPKEWLNARGYVETDVPSLRVGFPDLHNVYCIGTVASYASGGVLDSKYATKALLESIRLDLLGQDTGNRKTVHKPPQGETRLVPVGAKQGVGVLFGWRIPSFAVVMIKGRDYMVKEAPKTVKGKY